MKWTQPRIGERESTVDWIYESSPKQRWLDNIKNDLSERELSGEDGQDRVQWRRLIRIIDPHVKVAKDAEDEVMNAIQKCVLHSECVQMYKD